MSSKEVVFIHHSQRSGRLSHDSAQKVWGYVSRRSWQKRSKQITIKMWKPTRGFSGQDESHTLSDREAIAIPYSDLQRAYLSKICLRHVRPPEGLAMLETTLFIVCENTIKTYTLAESGTYTADEQRELDDSTVQLENWCFSIECGAKNLLNNNVSQAFASFEFASRLLKRCLSEKHRHLLSKILIALVSAQSRNAHDVVQQFLKQIAALTATSFGPRHPISVWARNLLVMGINPALMEKLCVAEINAASSAKFISRCVNGMIVFRMKCEVLRAGYHLHEAEQAYRDLVDLAPTSPTERLYLFQHLSVTMAELYLEHQSFFKAASIVSDAPADLEEYVSKGWAPTIPMSAPSSMTMIIWRLYILGQALAAQGDHKSAPTAFKMAVSAGLRYFDRDHPMNIRAQKAYSEYLSSQNLKEEADEMEQIVDVALDMYKLTPSNDE